MRVVAIFGPTGVGKTSVAIELAERLRDRGEDPVAISADALQVYRGLEILTGAATAEERERLEHRLVSFVPVTETFSAGQFAALAHAEIDSALAEGRRPIVVGGTGLYLQAALTDLELRPPPPPGVRERLVAELRHPTALRGLTMERERLYERIDARVERMVAAGAVEEVRAADAAGASATARKALGFEELLRGDVDGMKRRTRNYAKRQLTWMRKLRGVRVVDAEVGLPLTLEEDS